MKFEIIGKNVSITEAMRNKIEGKLSNLEKYFMIDENTKARVLVRTYPNSQKVEVTIPLKFGIIRAEEIHEDMYAAVDLVMDKLEDQIRRQKTRLNRFERKSLAEAFIEDAAEEDIPVKTKSIELSEMSLDEAIMNMELIGHSFYAYLDEETGEVSIVYRRNDGGYGVIETSREK